MIGKRSLPGSKMRGGGDEDQFLLVEELPCKLKEGGGLAARADEADHMSFQRFIETKSFL